VSLLNFLGLNGYQVSQQKAQMTQQQVTYLGLGILRGQRELGRERKEAICRTPEPQTVKELRTFSGMTGWCRLWIYNYDLIVKPLYELFKDNATQLIWTGEAKSAFEQLNRELESPGSWTSKCSKTLLAVFPRETRHCPGSAGSATAAIQESSCTFLRATGRGKQRMAWMSASSCSSCP